MMAELAAFWPQVLGISVSHLVRVSEAIEIGEAARQAVPGCFVFAGGHRLSFVADGVLGRAAGASARSSAVRARPPSARSPYLALSDEQAAGDHPAPDNTAWPQVDMTSDLEVVGDVITGQAQAPEGKFVTAIMAEIERESTEIRLLSCGHPAPLLVNRGLARLAEPLEADLPLGLSGLAAGERKEYTVPFGPDDRMLFYTDGISEARDKSGAFYPVDRCGTLLAGQDPDAALGRLYDGVLGHTSAVSCTMTPPRCSSCVRRDDHGQGTH